jgi:hypothetical protein
MSASTVTSTPKKRGRPRINPPKRPHISDGALKGHFTIRREEVHHEECPFLWLHVAVRCAEWIVSNE